MIRGDLDLTQIKVRVDSRVDEIISLLASEQKISKSAIARDLITQGIGQTLLPKLAMLFEQGKIGLKKIAQLTGIPPSDLFEQLSNIMNKSPMTDRLEAYTTDLTDRVISHLQNNM